MTCDLQQLSYLYLYFSYLHLPVKKQSNLSWSWSSARHLLVCKCVTESKLIDYRWQVSENEHTSHG